MLIPYCSKPTLTPARENLVILPKPRFACMCIHVGLWTPQQPQLYRLANILFCIKVWCVLVNYDYRYISWTVVPSCERNILMQIDTYIILIVLDPKHYMSQNILKYWSVWRWFKPSLKPCKVFRDFWDQPYVRASSVKLCLYGFSTMCHQWRWWH